MADSNNNQNTGRGWHGNSKGHADAGSKKNDQRTQKAAQAGGNASPGQFEVGSERAREAGRAGGSK